MRTNIIKHLIKKEITDVIRDKKTLFAMIGIPILMYPILMIIMSFIMQIAHSDIEDSVTKIMVEGEIPIGFELIDDDSNQIEIINEKDEADITINFIDKDEVNVTYDSSSSIKGFDISDLKKLFSQFETNQLINIIDDNSINYNILEADEIEYIDTATDTEQIGQLIGRILPMLLLLGVVMGVVYPALDIVTGEKERHTLETLMSLPLKPLEIVTSKFITIGICGIVATLLNAVSMFLSMGFYMSSLMQTMGKEMDFDVDFSEMIGPIIITILCLLIFTMFISAITMVCVSFPQTFKEAQNYITPIMMLSVFPSYITMMPNIELNTFLSITPVVNIAVLISDVFNFKFNLGLTVLVFVSNIAYATLAILLLSKVYSDEQILFGSKRQINLIGKDNLVKGYMPSTRDGIAIYAIGLMILLYSSLLIPNLSDNMIFQLICTQGIILATPLIYAYLIKSDFKKLFSLNRFNIKYVFIGIPLMAAGLYITIFIQNIMLEHSESLRAISEMMNEMLAVDDSVIMLLVISILPAICEEIFFRGFLFTSFPVEKHPIIVIVATSLMFGIFHMNALQLVTGLTLGLILGFVTYKSKSIYPAMILHFLNNFVAGMMSF